MSKSDTNPKAAVSLIDTPDQIVKKFKSAVTDSEACVRFAEGKDGVNNLMTIYACFTGADYDTIARDFAGRGYGAFKLAVAEVVVEGLRAFQAEYARLLADKTALQQAAAQGAEAASRIARRTTQKAMKKVGLWEVGRQAFEGRE
jgi:tryptophanyl-tRNA synthetase